MGMAFAPSENPDVLYKLAFIDERLCKIIPVSYVETGAYYEWLGLGRFSYDPEDIYLKKKTLPMDENERRKEADSFFNDAYDRFIRDGYVVVDDHSFKTCSSSQTIFKFGILIERSNHRCLDEFIGTGLLLDY